MGTKPVNRSQKRAQDKNLKKSQPSKASAPKKAGKKVDVKDMVKPDATKLVTIHITAGTPDQREELKPKLIQLRLKRELNVGAEIEVELPDGKHMIKVNSIEENDITIEGVPSKEDVINVQVIN